MFWRHWGGDERRGVVMVPVEFIGKARAFRSALVADHDAAILMATRLSGPFLARYRLRQPPTGRALADLAKGWRDRMPSAGRLRLVLDATRSRVSIDEIRAAPSKFGFCAWGDDAPEQAVAIVRVTVTVSTTQFGSNTLRAASVPLHALGRRYQRGWDVSDTAIRADLAELADPRPDLLARYGEFTVPLADGCWVGTVAEIEERGESVRILAVRTFVSEAMTARVDAPALAEARA